jgi:quaternary ammonium compound-resistance protein SugE
MSWVVLIVSGMLEAVWATAMSQSNGFSKLQPTIVFFIGVVLSMGGLAWALKSIPVGTGYAAWVGVGAVTTAAWAMARGTEPVSTLKIVFLAGIIVCIVGLQLVSSGESH